MLAFGVPTSGLAEALVALGGDGATSGICDRLLRNAHRIVLGASSIGRSTARRPGRVHRAPGQARHPVVLSGEYHDFKYAKTGLAPAKVV